MNKTSLFIGLFFVLIFGYNYMQHQERMGQAQGKIQQFTQSNQAKLDKLNAKSELTEHEQWLQQHLQKSLSNTQRIQQRTQATNYSLISMIGIMALGGLAFMIAQRRQSQPLAIDVSTAPPADHPLAKTLSWETMGGMAANFNSQHIHRINEHKLRIVSNAQWKIAALTFALVGLNTMGFAFYKASLNDSAWNPTLGLPFLAAGIGLLAYGFLKGWLIDQNQRIALSPLGGQWSFNDIEALQFISGVAGGRSRVFPVYEVNLISKDGQRATLLRSGRYEDAMANAAELAELLQRPLWRR